MIYSKGEDKGGNLMGKKILSTLLVLLVITGCSQNKDNDGISGKNGSLLKETLEQKKEEKSVKDKSDDKKGKSDDEDKSEVINNQTIDTENKTAVNEQSTEKKSNSNEKTVESSKQKTEQSSSGSATEAAKPSQPQKPTQQEPSQPSKPAEPKPSSPTCNDTIPNGAFSIEREAEIDAQVQAEMTENQLHGDGTFTQYKTEYGETECGTRYFYIIRIYG